MTATPSKTEATYGEKVTITTKLDKMSDKLTVDQYVLYADGDVVESNQTGTFEITPVNGATYKVQVIFVKSGQQAKDITNCKTGNQESCIKSRQEGCNR